MLMHVTSIIKKTIGNFNHFLFFIWMAFCSIQGIICVIRPQYLHRNNDIGPVLVDNVLAHFPITMYRCPYGTYYWPTNDRPRFLIIKARPSHLLQKIKVCSTWDEPNNGPILFFNKLKERRLDVIFSCEAEVGQ